MAVIGILRETFQDLGPSLWREEPLRLERLLSQTIVALAQCVRAEGPNAVDELRRAEVVILELRKVLAVVANHDDESSR